MSTRTMRLHQDKDAAVYTETRQRLTYRYAWIRSNDSRQNNDVGQDYLTIRDDGKRLAFVLCDGVSQSFIGNLAAKTLGDGLIEWLWENQAIEDIKCDLLKQYLQALTQSVSSLVAIYPLPDNLPEMLHNVLMQKRTQGSESIFATGLIDTSQNILWLAWMGDIRIRLWDHETEVTAQLGDTFLTRERWSSKHGLIGQLHAISIPLKNIERIAAYTDGLAYFDDKLMTHPPDTAVNQALSIVEQLPTSDDATYFDVCFHSHLSDKIEVDGAFTKSLPTYKNTINNFSKSYISKLQVLNKFLQRLFKHPES